MGMSQGYRQGIPSRSGYSASAVPDFDNFTPGQSYKSGSYISRPIYGGTS